MAEDEPVRWTATRPSPRLVRPSSIDDDGSISDSQSTVSPQSPPVSARASIEERRLATGPINISGFSYRADDSAVTASSIGSSYTYDSFDEQDGTLHLGTQSETVSMFSPENSQVDYDDDATDYDDHGAWDESRRASESRVEEESLLKSYYYSRVWRTGLLQRIVAFLKTVNRRTWIILSVLALVVCAFIVLLVTNRDNVYEAYELFLEWVNSLGWIGPIVIAVVYAILTVLCLPGSVLTIGAGFIFSQAYGSDEGLVIPLLIGTGTISVGSTVGASLAFLLGRSILREWTKSRIEQYAEMTAIDRAVARKGWLIVFLCRLTPVLPFVVLNYAFGVTGVSFLAYATASWLGMIPGTILYVYLGCGVSSIGGSLSDVMSGDLTEQADKLKLVFFCVGLVFVLVVVVFITYIARKAIRDEIAQQEQLESAQEDVEAQLPLRLSVSNDYSLNK